MRFKLYLLFGSIVVGIIVTIVVLLSYVDLGSSNLVIKKKMEPEAVWYCQGCAWNRAHTFMACQRRRSIKGVEYAKESLVRSLCKELKLGEYGQECNEKILFGVKCGKEKMGKK